MTTGNVGSNSSLEIEYEGNISDVDLIIISSGWTLLRFISKVTGDCIIVPFSMDRKKMKKKAGDISKSELCKAERSSDFIIALQEISLLVQSDNIPVVVDAKVMVSVACTIGLTPK